jgi:hypothetical protein
MRRFSLIFVVCASGFAQTSVSCDGGTSYGDNSASCATADSYALAQIVGVYVNATAWAAPGHGSASASASFSLAVEHWCLGLSSAEISPLAAINFAQYRLTMSSAML